MPSRKSVDTQDEDTEYDDYSEEHESLEEELGLEDSDYDAPSSILDEFPVSDLVHQYGIEEFTEAIIDSISYNDLEKLRDIISDYLE